ncbi:MAG: single-stranded DNA-binding protein [Fimbriimonadales bacterium]|nr:MAG: single-stranded DNA-binding protein [Fimbriimonadales bacterium]
MTRAPHPPNEKLPDNREELELLLEALPPVIRQRLQDLPDLDDLIEVVLDFGRPAEIRLKTRFERFHDYIVSEDDLRYVSDRISEFGKDNRAGIERTLHRISAIRNRQGRIIGLTCRVGRAIYGTIDIIEDIVESGRSILLLGRPGIGKTTKLREMARLLADRMNKRVVIVDTSNEIAGDGDIPHPAIGSARRMQVVDPSLQHQIMIEAVENHMPEVVVIDEIGTEAEAYAARTIAERGVQLIGTAHGQTLENLMLNPTLCDLIGGIQAVTLSDEEARRRGTQKTVLERKAPPTFDVVIEILDYDRLAVHHDVQQTVDAILRGAAPRPEIRIRGADGQVEVVAAEATKRVEPVVEAPVEPKRRPVASSVVRVFPYGIARTRLERVVRERRLPIAVSSDPESADVILAIRSAMQRKPERFRERLGRSVPVVVVRSNTLSQIAEAMQEILAGQFEEEVEHTNGAMEEVLEAIRVVKSRGKPYDLSPQPSPVRRTQHRAIEQHNLRSESVGKEPRRFVRILPP